MKGCPALVGPKEQYLVNSTVSAAPHYALSPSPCHLLPQHPVLLHPHVTCSLNTLFSSIPLSPAPSTPCSPPSPCHLLPQHPVLLHPHVTCSLNTLFSSIPMSPAPSTPCSPPSPCHLLPQHPVLLHPHVTCWDERCCSRNIAHPRRIAHSPSPDLTTATPLIPDA